MLVVAVALLIRLVALVAQAVVVQVGLRLWQERQEQPIEVLAVVVQVWLPLQAQAVQA